MNPVARRAVGYISMEQCVDITQHARMYRIDMFTNFQYVLLLQYA